MSKSFALMGLLAALLVAAPQAGAQGYQVIVHAGNPASTMPKAMVSKLFLKQQRTWPSGTPVAPVDLAREAAPRAAFSTAVHGRPVASIEEYWLQQVFAGKDEPPATQRDDAAVIAFVSANPGGVGYVSASATLPGGVKRLVVQ
jgi:ABC-type phosphate transport system substrate-binding protein